MQTSDGLCLVSRSVWLLVENRLCVGGLGTKAKARQLLDCCYDPTGSYLTFPAGALLLVLLSLFPWPRP